MFQKWIAAGCWLLAGVVAAPAMAQEQPPRVAVSGNVTLTSDYRFRGVSLTATDAALQGGVSFAGRSGVSGGLWASTISSGGSGAQLELDLFAAKSFTWKGASIAAGGIGYLYPGASGLAYGEATASVARSIGPLDLSVGANYAPRQANLGRRDNIYVFSNAAAPLGKIGKTPITAAAGVGYESGVFAFGKDKLDWTLRLTASKFGFDLSLAYIDTNVDNRLTRARRRFIEPQLLAHPPTARNQAVGVRCSRTSSGRVNHRSIGSHRHPAGNFPLMPQPSRAPRPPGRAGWHIAC